MLTAAELIAFEREIADAFNAGQIRAPVHLSGGNEQQLIEIFRDIGPDDWVTGSWRMHYQCLLKGVPPEKLRAEIFAGRSIALCFPEHRILSSAIVGGSLSIALGIALGIKRRGGTERVHAFCGDMTALTGTFTETVRYASGQGLPVRFIVENNDLSVCTPTDETWGHGDGCGIDSFDYKLPWPHSGAGVRVQF